MARPREYQRSKFIAAFDALYSEWEHPTRRMGHFEAREFVEGVVGSRWWRQRFGHRSTVTHFAAGRTAALGGTHEVRLRVAAEDCHAAKLLQLLAWHMIPTDASWHGREFAGLFHALVKRFISKEAALQLRTEYARNGVKWKAAYTYSPEGAAALRRQGLSLADFRTAAAMRRLESSYRV